MLVGSAKKLTEEEIQERLAAYAEKADPAIRDEIVLQYCNLVESIGRRFVGACEPLEDLCQEGYIGLIASVDKYDVSKGVKFSTYATHFIIGQIKHYLRDKGKIIKEPAWLQELNQKMTKVIESLAHKFNRQPTEKEIAGVMQMPESAVVDLLTTREVFKVGTLDGDNEETPNRRDPEKIKDDKVVAFQLPLEDKIVLETAMERLKDIEQKVISEHYYKGHNQTEIAKKMGISCNYVSHLLRNGTKKLRKILATEEIRDAQIQRTLVSARPTIVPPPREDINVIDNATGIYNRHYLERRLEEEISRACRSKYKMALVLVDICLPEDTEKYLRLVRLDDVLYAAAQTIRASVRKMDVVARFGQTSFALILPHTAGHAVVVADRLRAIVSAIEIESGRKTVRIGAQARIGMAKYPIDAKNYRDLIQMACRDMGVDLDELLEEDVSFRKAA